MTGKKKNKKKKKKKSNNKKKKKKKSICSDRGKTETTAKTKGDKI